MDTKFKNAGEQLCEKENLPMKNGYNPNIGVNPELGG